MARVGVLNYLNDGKVQGLGRRGCVCERDNERREKETWKVKGKRLLALHEILVVKGRKVENSKFQTISIWTKNRKIKPE